MTSAGRGWRAALTAALVLVGAGAATPSAAQAAAVPTLVAVQAGHHPGHDRVVFAFKGGLPTFHVAPRWVDAVIEDGSGRLVHVAGHAFLQFHFDGAQAHDSSGRTVRARKTFALPNVTQTLLTGDFEGEVSVAVGAQRRTDFTWWATSSPSPRVVVDVATPYDWTQRYSVTFRTDRFAPGQRIRMSRPLIPPTLAQQALERLFAGPTVGEQRDWGARFVRSGATGFADLSIAGGIARVRLTGGCDSGGQRFTIATEIIPTLRQFPTVDYVKVYGPQGYTNRPSGNVDSIPPCLES